MWGTYCSNGQQYAYVDNVQKNLNLGGATLTNNRRSESKLRTYTTWPEVSENNKGNQGLDEGDRVASTAQGWLGMMSKLLHYWGHVLALVLCEGKLCVAGLSAAVACEDTSTIGAASSDVVHVEHACTKGVANGDEKHSMVH